MKYIIRKRWFNDRTTAREPLREQRERFAKQSAGAVVSSSEGAAVIRGDTSERSAFVVVSSSEGAAVNYGNGLTHIIMKKEAVL